MALIIAAIVGLLLFLRRRRSNEGWGAVGNDDYSPGAGGVERGHGDVLWADPEAGPDPESVSPFRDNDDLAAGAAGGAAGVAAASNEKRIRRVPPPVWRDSNPSVLGRRARLPDLGVGISALAAGRRAKRNADSPATVYVRRVASVRVSTCSRTKIIGSSNSSITRITTLISGHTRGGDLGCLGMQVRLAA